MTDSDDILRDSIRGDIKEVNRRLRVIEDKREMAEKDGCGPMPKPIWSPSEERFRVKDEHGVTSNECDPAPRAPDEDGDICFSGLPCWYFWGIS